MTTVFAPAAIAVVGVLVGYFLPHPARRGALSSVAADAIPEATPAESHIAQALDGVDAAMLLVDARGHIVQANQTAARIFAGESASMVGSAIIEATGSIDLDRFVTEALAGRASRGTVTVTIRRGETTLRVIVEPLPSGQVIIAAVDQSALIEAERSRREFVGNVSHELRTPLAGMKLMVETLRAGDDEATRAFFYPKLSAEVDRMVELVEHLLDLARSESRRMTLRSQQLLLSDLVVGPLEAAEEEMRQRGITLERKLEPAVFIGDGNRIIQVITNLVDNAVRHTPAGGRITVFTGLRDGLAVLEVADTGVGIPFRDLPHVFERFYVVDRSRAKGVGGLGLGLAIVKANVEAHGGSIVVASEYGTGTTFTAKFPLRATVDEA